MSSAVSGNTWIQGGAGDDIIFGGADEDRISGGVGSDQLYGGDGDDVYRFDGSIGFDTISDTSGHDTIVIEASAGGGNWGTFYRDGADLFTSTNMKLPALRLLIIMPVSG